MLEIDGSMGEGGGQVLRTSLALAMVTGTTIHLWNIRANRAKPGLMRQHLTAVRAAAEVCGGTVKGAEVGSREIWFKPGPLRGGDYRFAIGTAGSATLVLQTVLPALLRADSPSTVTVEGGTHNPMAPPYEFLAEAFLPLLRRMGAGAALSLEKHGFAPAGGGRLRLEITPAPTLAPLHLADRGRLLGVTARSVLAGGLARDIAKRELESVRKGLHPEEIELVTDVLPAGASEGPGNVLFVTARFEHVTEVFSAIGQRGVSAEKVAERVYREARPYLAASTVTVGEHLADQLLLPMALAGGGSFTTVSPTLHTRTNAEVIRLFLPVRMHLEEQEGSHWTVRLDG